MSRSSCWILTASIACACAAGAAAIAVSVRWKSAKPVAGCREALPPALPVAEPARSWSPESLSRLGFDETLTLLSGEAERWARTGGREGSRDLETILAAAARIETLGMESDRRIGESASFYARLSPAARIRFEEFRAEYDRRRQAVREATGRLIAGDIQAAREIGDMLRAWGAERPPPSPPARKNLPNLFLQGEPKEPRATEEEWTAGQKVGLAPGQGTGDSSGGWLEGIFGMQAAHAQSSSDPDLEATPEVALSSEIRSLAGTLGMSPVKIVDWVRNNIEFVPVRGALQSSTACLQNRRGTAEDIASLLIALLRASGVRARYQAGTVRLPLDLAMSWLGSFQDPLAAASLLASGGIPSVLQVDRDGRPVAVRFEHVWVRAFIDWVPSRGACTGEGDTWLDLDAAVKPRTALPSRDLKSFLNADPGAGPFDEAAFRGRLDAALAGITFDPATGEVKGVNPDELGALVEPGPQFPVDRFLRTFGDASLNELCGLAPIARREGEVLCSSPPFEILARGWERPALGDGERFRVRFEVRRGGQVLLEHGMTAAEASLSRFSLAFVPETELDGTIIESQIPSPAGSRAFERLLVAGVRVRPDLRRDGATAVLGSPVGMGESLDLAVIFTDPALRLGPIVHRIAAGQMTAIGLDLVAVPRAIFGGLLDSFQEYWRGPETGFQDGPASAFLEIVLSALAQVWFDAADRAGRAAVSALGCEGHRYPSAGVVAAVLVPETAFGLPLSVRFADIGVDVAGDRSILVARDGDRSRAARAGLLRGFLASSLESLVPALFFNVEEEAKYWLSTSNALELAAKAGDSLVLVTRATAPLALAPGRIVLAEEDLEAIRSAAEGGMIVYAHAHRLAGRGRLHAGYAILDPATSSGSFRVSSGFNGGDAAECKECPPSRACCNRPGGCAGTMEAMARTLASSLKVESKMLDFIKEVSLDSLDLSGKLPPSVKVMNAILSVLQRSFDNLDIYDAALNSLPPNVQKEVALPLTGLVVMLTGLEMINQLICGLLPMGPLGCSWSGGSYINIVQGTAWRGVKNVLKYQARMEAEIAGVDVPPDCLESVLGSN